MPPTLDLSKTLAYSPDLLLHSPGINLRRFPAHPVPASADRVPLSATSSRFSFAHLIVSPLPSPSLPALIPRHGKPLPRRRPRRLLRAALWFLALALPLYLTLRLVRCGLVSAASTFQDYPPPVNTFAMMADSELPAFPAPVVVTDHRRRPRWTVAIPPQLPFPLAPKQYADICRQIPDVASLAESLRQHVVPVAHHSSADHYHQQDPNFIDVHEATHQGLLHDAPPTEDSDQDTHICEKSMTVLLESTDAGLGQMLMMLWTAYGLAQQEKRAFFIDDSRWAYGTYQQYFQSPPAPKCRPPPRHEILPCPRAARHQLVSAATIPHVFGAAFQAHFSSRQIFSLARAGYEALFWLAAPDAEYLHRRSIELAALTQHPAASLSAPIVGIHVRHGDRHPAELQYSHGWIPLPTYMSAAEEMMQAVATTDSALQHALILTASDDPDVYQSDELNSTLYNTLRAQQRISLASQPARSPPPTAAAESRKLRLGEARKFVEDAIGWEGGFFSGMFWSLGASSRSTSPAAAARATAAPSAYANCKGQASSDHRHEIPASDDALRLRELVGRAYLLDLAVLGRSDGVVCTASSMGCRLLAVMIGWDKALGRQARWRNVDAGAQWRALDW